jgi:hypothetical protein
MTDEKLVEHKCEMHHSGLGGFTHITFDGEPDMFVHPDTFEGFYTTGKCIHCGKVMVTEQDLKKEKHD